MVLHMASLQRLQERVLHAEMVYRVMHIVVDKISDKEKCEKRFDPGCRYQRGK